MFLTRSAGMLKKGVIRFLVKRYGTLVIGSALEMFFGINFFPTQTLVVVLVFYFTLQERKAAALEKALEENKKGYPAEVEPAYN